MTFRLKYLAILIVCILAGLYSWQNSKLCMDTVGYATVAYEIQGQSLGDAKDRAFSELKGISPALFRYYTTSNERRVQRYESLEVFANWMPQVRHKILFILAGVVLPFDIWFSFKLISVLAVIGTMYLLFTLYSWSWRDLILLVGAVFISLYFRETGRFQTPDALCGFLFVLSIWCYLRGYYRWTLLLVPFMIAARMQFGIFGLLYWVLLFNRRRVMTLVSIAASVWVVILIEWICQPYSWWLHYCNMIDGGIQAYPLEHLKPFDISLILSTTLSLVAHLFCIPNYTIVFGIIGISIHFYSIKQFESRMTWTCAAFIGSHLILMPLLEDRYISAVVLIIFAMFIRWLSTRRCCG